MRLHLLSDLHLEMGAETPDQALAARGLEIPDVAADAVVLAGDIAQAAEGVRWAARRWPHRPVVYVLGNHEHYGGRVDATLAACRAAARGTRVHVLENDVVTIAGVDILGATLWTDFRLAGMPGASAAHVADWMPDFRVIRNRRDQPLDPRDTVACHRRTRMWLRRRLAAATRPCVVVTHHAPHPRSDHFGDLASAAFVSDLRRLLMDSGPALWIHGHTHGRDDYRVGPTRVVSNQAGYAGEGCAWDPGLVVDVPE
jgi:Icc-related predicted phosphoesterase